MRVLAVLATVIVAAACGDSTAPTQQPSTTVTSVSVTPAADTLVAVGATVRLVATAYQSSGSPVSGKTFSWSSSNESVATVDPSGLVTAAGNGTTTITATADGISGSASIRVDQVATKLGYIVQPSSLIAGAPLSPAVQVAVQDQLGNTVVGAANAITLGITTGTGAVGAAVTGTVTRTAVDGIATFDDIAIDKVATDYTLTATADGLSAAGSATFAVDAGPPTALVFGVQPGAVTAGRAIMPAIQIAVHDALGNLVDGANDEITLAIKAGTGSVGAVLGGTVTQQAINGVATFSDLTINLVGTDYTLTAVAGVLTAATSNPFAVNAGTATRLAFAVEPSTVVSGTAMTPAVEVVVQDAQGNTVPDAVNTITLGITAGTGVQGAVLSGTVALAAVNGVAIFSDLVIDKAGTSYTLTASAAGFAGAISATFDVNAGAATALSFAVQPTTVTAGQPITPAIVVTIQDAQGNVVPSAMNQITLDITAGSGTPGASLGGTLAKSAVDGIAAFDDIAVDKAGTGYALTATATGLSDATSSAFAVNAGAATGIGFSVQPSDVDVAMPMTPAIQVAVEDAFGNVVPNATNTITLAITAGTGAGGASLAGTVMRAATSGVATFDDLAIDKVGTGYTLTATATGLATGTSTPFTVNIGDPAQLAFLVHPSTVTAGAAITPSVQVVVQDVQGNTVPSATNSVSLEITPETGTAGAFLGGTTAIAAVNGVAIFSALTIDKVGSGYTLTATATGLTSTTSTAFAVNVGAAARLAFLEQPTDVVVGTQMSPAVQVAVQDAFGNAATTSTASVTLALVPFVGPEGATLGGTVTQSAVSGVATFADITVDLPGTGYTLTASASGLSNGVSGTFAGRLIASSVVAGRAYTCALTGSGQAYCWGRNQHGQLGDGTQVDHSTPVAVNSGLTFAQLVAGRERTCGLTGTAQAYCWGRNDVGQLGDGTTMTRLTPVAVSGGLEFIQLTAGNEKHTCGLTSAGQAYCWGLNKWGQLGDGTTIDRRVPTLVIGGVKFVELTAGGNHTCGLTSAGQAYCWGQGGRIGDGTTDDRLSPVLVSGGAVFTQLEAGYDHTCGPTNLGGTSLCWGVNGRSQLGNPATPSLGLPGVVSGGFTFTEIQGGASHTCALTAAATAYCWGFGTSGQMGDGATITRAAPVTVSGSLSFVQLTAGDHHNCGVTTSGAVYCWGFNSSMQLGDETTTNRSVPVRTAVF